MPAAVFARYGLDWPGCPGHDPGAGSAPGEHLTTLINELLDVGRIVTGKVHLVRHAVDLGALAQRTLETFTAAGRAGVHVPILSMESVWIDADETRIE
jgi:signal transduction histidine kinase